MTESADRAEQFDVVFVGAGVASAFTLRAMAECAIASGRTKLRTAVVERADSRFGGVPYGRRSGALSLVITGLRDFLGDEERAAFASWMTEHRQRLLDELQDSGGPNARRWISEHSPAMAAGDFDDLFVPRRWFGQYLDDTVARALSAAESASAIDHEYLVDTVLDVERDGDHYNVVLADSPTPLRARHVVLAVGSMPVRHRLVAPTQTNGLLVDDPYEPGLEQHLRALEERVTEHGPATVLIIGSNASALEMLYLMADRDALATCDFVVISPSGALPETIRHQPSHPAFVPCALDGLVGQSGRPTAREIFDAARADLAAARQAGVSLTDCLPAISARIGGLVGASELDQRLEFASTWGPRLARYQRRAGSDYADNAQRLFAEGRLELLAGSYHRIVEADDAGLTVEYGETGETGQGHEPRRLRPVGAIFNCAGFTTTIDAPPSGLIATLSERGLCTPVSTGVGLVVDETLRTSGGLHVIGPLLAGNVIDGSAVWHLEQCARIQRLSGPLAERLLQATPVSG